MMLICIPLNEKDHTRQSGAAEGAFGCFKKQPLILRVNRVKKFFSCGCFQRTNTAEKV